MAHYAFITDPDESGVSIVTEVIVGREETEGDWETYYGNFRKQLCRRTSYNAREGINLRTGEPAFRHTFAAIGYRFDPSVGPDGAFLPPEVP